MLIVHSPHTLTPGFSPCLVSWVLCIYRQFSWISEASVKEAYNRCVPRSLSLSINTRSNHIWSRPCRIPFSSIDSWIISFHSSLWFLALTFRFGSLRLFAPMSLILTATVEHLGHMVQPSTPINRHFTHAYKNAYTFSISLCNRFDNM